MRSQHIILVIACVLPLAVAADDELGRYELVPFGGFRVGGEFDTASGDIDVDDAASFGVALNARADYNTQWQVYFSHQATDLNTGGLFVAGQDRVDLNVDYLQFGGTYYLEGNTVTPYVAVTLGAARFDPDEPGFDSETFFSFSAAGGLRLPVAERLALNFEARWLGSLVDSDSDIFCFTSPQNNACLVQVDGTLLSQFDFTLGAVFRF